MGVAKARINDLLPKNRVSVKLNPLFYLAGRLLKDSSQLAAAIATSNLMKKQHLKMRFVYSPTLLTARFYKTETDPVLPAAGFIAKEIFVACIINQAPDTNRQ